MKSNTFNKLILIISLLPLWFALFLSCYHYDWSQFTGYPLFFARINSYIYAHAYSAFLLVLLIGLQLRHFSDNLPYKYKLLVYGILTLCVLLSFTSFADKLGMRFLIFCWLVFSWVEFYLAPKLETNQSFLQKIPKINIWVIGLLIALLVINN